MEDNRITEVGNFSNSSGPWETITFSVCGTFSVLSVFVSVLLIWNHLRNWNFPEHQIIIVRILIMVPIYSIDSWFSVRFRHYSLYFDIVRDCYEAYVLYQFFSLLVAYIENTTGKVSIEEVLFDKEEQMHPCPLCCLPSFKPGPTFYLVTKQCILQYVIIKPFLAILTAVLEAFHVYEEGNFNFRYGYLYVTFVSNLSVSISMYFLVLFYLATQEELAPYRPVAKLASIKAILLFSFWQSVLIGILAYFEVIPDQVGGWTKNEVATGLNDFMICIEMFLLAIVHAFVFPYQEYQVNNKLTLYSREGVYNAVVTPVMNFSSVVNQTDVIKDLDLTFHPDRMKNAKLREKERENMQEFLAQTPSLGDSDEDQDEDVKSFYVL